MHSHLELKSYKDKVDKNNKKQVKTSKKQMCESKVRQWLEEDGVNYEEELNKRK